MADLNPKFTNINKVFAENRFTFQTLLSNVGRN